jgi:hypothetical protein
MHIKSRCESGGGRKKVILKKPKTMQFSRDGVA